MAPFQTAFMVSPNQPWSERVHKYAADCPAIYTKAIKARARRTYQATWGVPITIRTAESRPPPIGISHRELEVIVVFIPVLPSTQPPVPVPLFQPWAPPPPPGSALPGERGRQAPPLRPPSRGSRGDGADDGR